MFISRVSFLFLLNRNKVSQHFLRPVISSRLFSSEDIARMDTMEEIRKRCQVAEETTAAHQNAIHEQQKIAWDSLWKDNITPWDLGRPTPALLSELQSNFKELSLNRPTVRVLVPGCGAGYDLISLACHFDKLLVDKHHKNNKQDITDDIGSTKEIVVVGLDITKEPLLLSKDIIDKSFQESKIILHNTRIEFVTGDFFESKRTNIFTYNGQEKTSEEHQYDEVDTYDFIFDYTFFCALPPLLRKKWGERMSELLTPDTGRLLTFMFPILPNPEIPLKGPPFSVTIQDYRNVLEHNNGVVMDPSGPRKSNESVESRAEKELVCWWHKA